MPAPVYFLSDAHIGAVLVPDPQDQKVKLDRFFRIVEEKGKSLVIVGDLFDFWYEWAHVIPKNPFAVLCRLRGLAERGIEVHYLAGNHDFRLHGFLESEIGMRVHLNSLSADIGGQSVFVFHGDGILQRDHGYRLVKRILRNRVTQRIFLWLHPDVSMALARGTSVVSRTATRKDPADDEEYLHYARGKFAEGYQAVVMGHSHRPVEHADGARTYVNLGDWITEYTFGVHDGVRLRLHRLEA